MPSHDPAKFQYFDSRPEAEDSGAPPLGEQQLVTSVCSQSARGNPRPGTFTASYSRQHTLLMWVASVEHCLELLRSQVLQQAHSPPPGPSEPQISPYC